MCDADGGTPGRSVEVMFEKYNVPALFLAKNAVKGIRRRLELAVPRVDQCSGVDFWQVLTSFASGRATSLVIDRSARVPRTCADS